MGNGFAGSKPFLGDGELLPAFTIDIPGHSSGNIVGVHCVFSQNIKYFINSILMMFLQFVYPSLKVGKKIAVSGKDNING